MSRRDTTELVRIGILTLPLAGILALVGVVSSYNEPEPRVDPRAAAQAAVSTGYFMSQFADILSLAVLIFGVMALTAYLANTRVRGLVLGAMVLSIFGIALILTALGLRAYALPAIGQAYLNGQQDAITMADAFLGSPVIYLFTPVIVLYSAGFLLFGIAIWRSGVLRKGAAAVSLALHAPLLSSFIRPQTSLASILGALLFVLGGVLISLDVFRRSSTAKAEATPPPR